MVPALVTASLSPSTSVSFVRTLPVTGSAAPLAMSPLSATATGASLVPVTVTVSVLLEVPPLPSLTV